MKRNALALALAATCICFTASAQAQMGMNFFKKPNIADIFRPVVGNGATYDTQKSGSGDAAKPTEMSVIGKESVEGKDGYWLEFSQVDAKSGKMVYAKMLVTRDDFQFHRMVFQAPGQPAMEMPFNPNDTARKRQMEDLDKWHLVGSESVTVPAGTFSTQHWKKDEGAGDVWVADNVSPFGMVKYASASETMTLTKVFTGAKDHITGPVQKFDLQQMMQQRAQRP
jgi:hypothetical protein